MKTNPQSSAFPNYSQADGEGSCYGQPGLSNREFFAAIALNGLLSLPSDDGYPPARLIAKVAIQYADALIEELNAPKYDMESNINNDT